MVNYVPARDRLSFSHGSRQSQRQNQQTHVCRHAQCSQHHHYIPTRPELLPPQTLIPDFREELAIPLLPPIRTDQQHASTIYRKQGPNAVELAGEDLEDDQRERKLAEGSADVGALEGTLCGADLDKFGGGEFDGSGAVETQTEMVFWVPGL